jgi:type I restriction enzyme S subunit
MREGWEIKPLLDCLEKSPKVTKIPKKCFKTQGRYPIVSQEKSLINGYWDDESDAVLVDHPFVVFGDHTQVVKFVDFSFVVGADGVKLLKPKQFLDPAYFYYFLLGHPLKALGYARHFRLLKELYVAIPPFPEQKRIVAILDDAFASIDASIANTEKNLANARELFESYLNSVFNQPVMKEATQKLPEVCENLDRKRIPITKSRRMPGDIPYYGATGVVDHVKDYIFDEDLLLVSEDGANLLARTYPIAFSISGKAWVNNHAHVMRFSSSESQRFVEYYLNSITLEPYVSGMAQPKLNQKALNSITIPVPSADEKRIIVDKLDEIVAGKDQLSKIYQQKLTALAELKQSLLQKAFSGELTADKAASDATLKEEACP